jgi:hypothetical protein
VLALRQNWPAYCGLLAGFAAVPVITWAFVLPRFAVPTTLLWLVVPLLSLVIGLLFFLIAGTASIPFTANLGYAEHRTRAAGSLGLTGSIGLELVYFTEAARRPHSMLDHGEVGLFGCGPSGVVYLGTDGTRLAHTRGEIARVTVERLPNRPWRSALRVDLGDGRALWFAFLEGTTFAANRAKAAEAAARLAPR